VIGNNFIDANFFDRTGGPEDTAVDTILLLHEESAFRLLLPYSVKAEIEHPNTPADVKRKAEQFAYSNEVELTDPERATHDKIRALIRGNAQPGQHNKDAFHLVESQKYGGQFFITKDGRLLKKAEEIWEMLHLSVVKPSDFLAAYLSHAEKRHL
jgi:hypothetical protein